MIEFTDIYQLLLLLMVGIITSIELYLLIINLKRKPMEQTTNMYKPPDIPRVAPSFIPAPTMGTMPPLATPYTTRCEASGLSSKVNTNVN